MRVWVAIWVGSTIISRRLADAIGGGSGGASVFKLGLLFGAALFVKGLPGTKRIIWACALAWLLTAVVLGLRAKDDQDEKTEGATGDGPALPTRDELARVLHRIGTPHCHTAALAEALGIPAERAREALAAAKIPTHTVRMKGRGSSTGVKAANFPPLPRDGEGTPGGDVAAGQDGNNNSNNAPKRRAGERLVTFPDPADPDHYYVIELPREGAARIVRED